jgi:hypothetical protein
LITLENSFEGWVILLHMCAGQPGKSLGVEQELQSFSGS